MNSEIWDIIGKKVKGEITKSELSSLNDWLTQSIDNQSILNDALIIWEKTISANQKQKLDIDQEWKDFKVYRFEQEEKEPQNQDIIHDNRISLFPSWLYRVAAILLVGVGMLYFFNFYKNENTTTVATTTHKSTNQKLKVTLPDQSEIWLNKFSEISYSEDFGNSHRTLQLKGEAFFDVKRSNQPFIILGSQSKTEVLGTAFNVKSIEAAPLTEVVVVRGKVAFSGNYSKTNQVVLTPGEKATLSSSTQKISKSINSDRNFLSWKEEILTFDRTSFNQVIKTLNSYFGINISTKNKQLLSCHFTGTFDKPQLKQVLDILSASMGFNYNIEDHTVSISGDGC